MILQPYSSEKASGPEEAEGSEALVMIVVPASNEELTIGEFVDWCWEGLKKAGVEGKILIVDSSTDRTAEIAESKGAQVRLNYQTHIVFHRVAEGWSQCCTNCAVAGMELR